MLEQTRTVSIQDYLKHIYELTENGQSASTNALAKKLHVSAPSATGMVKKLAAAEPPLVDYHKHQGAALTPAGELAALEVLRHHRLLESWLVQSLGYSWDEVHDEACQLEIVAYSPFDNNLAVVVFPDSEASSKEIVVGLAITSKVYV